MDFQNIIIQFTYEKYLAGRVIPEDDKAKKPVKKGAPAEADAE